MNGTREGNRNSFNMKSQAQVQVCGPPDLWANITPARTTLSSRDEEASWTRAEMSSKKTSLSAVV